MEGLHRAADDALYAVKRVRQRDVPPHTALSVRALAPAAPRAGTAC